MEYAGIGLAATAGLTAAAAVGYRVIRPRYPATVKCHFCGEVTRVPYENRNCWDCLQCEQYNGFLSDGGYNKPIPAQYYESMNHTVTAVETSDDTFNSKSDVLCSVCSRNQLLKVKQLANFVPYNEANYDIEVEAYKYHLEQIYHLCRMCEHKVKHMLAKQDVDLLQQFDDSYNAPPPESSFSDWEDSFNCSTHLACRLSAPWHVTLLRATSVLCALTLLLVSSYHLLSDSEIGFKPAHYLPTHLISYVKSMYDSAISLALVGTFTTLLAIYVSGKQRLTVPDSLDAFSWLAMMVLYSYFTSQQIPVSDKYLLQCCIGTVNTALSLWCAAVPRFERKNKLRIRKKKRRYDFDSSTRSSMAESPAVSVAPSPNRSPAPSVAASFNRSPPKPQGNSSAPGSPNTDPFGRFETMSLGQKVKKRPKSVFAAFGGSGDPPISEPVASTSYDRGNLESLRTPRPLLKPAKFNPSSASSTSGSFKPVPSTSQSVRSGSLFNESQRSWNGGRGDNQGTNRGQFTNDWEGDRVSQYGDSSSMYNRPRSAAAGLVEEEDDSDHSSSPCPVDTTSPPCSQSTTQARRTKRSIFVQIILGFSIGANIFLLLYFCTDFENIVKKIAAHFR